MSVTRNHDGDQVTFGNSPVSLEVRTQPPDISFFLPGKPQQQGSKTPWGADANEANLKPYRFALGSAAHTQMQDAGETEPFDGPCRLDVIFVYDRPRSHFNGKGEVKASAPRYKTSAPDRDKLLRSVGDALTGIVWKDDARVVSGHTTKEYGEFAGTHVDVWLLR